MISKFIGRVCRIAAVGALVIGSASCVDINENLGENFIPNDQKWKVYVPQTYEFRKGDIVMRLSDSLSAYSSRRFTFGNIKDTYGESEKAASFTLVPLDKDISFGKNTVVKKFHFAAVRDTLSTVTGTDVHILQNVNVYALKEPLDSTVLYTGEFSDRERLEKFVDFSGRITSGIPVYDGGDSLSFEFGKDYAKKIIAGIEAMKTEDRDTLQKYLKAVPGIYICSDAPEGNGGRINMFDIALETNSSGYVTGNYAELTITADYGDREKVDTSFLFIFGPSTFIENDATSIPSQYAFNSSGEKRTDALEADTDGKSYVASDKIIVEGGSGLKPVIKAHSIKELTEEAIRTSLGKPDMTDFSNVVINKATVILPYDEDCILGGWDGLELFPETLSPTVKLTSTNKKYVSYAGLTDSSIESENQGDINRSLSMYSPDMSHHIQEILKIDAEAEDYDETISKYDVWMLIMHTEYTTTSSSTSNSDYYNNLLYNSYYNSMMYDPYGYGGYGYGGYGYGYGSYGYSGYGYNNYYNYLMMAQYASGSSTSTTSESSELDKDRIYVCSLNGPEKASGNKPRLQITFSIPKN